MMDKFNDDCGIVQLEIRGMALAETQYLPWEWKCMSHAANLKL
jgi:hypothetical protein